MSMRQCCEQKETELHAVRKVKPDNVQGCYFLGELMPRASPRSGIYVTVVSHRCKTAHGLMGGVCRRLRTFCAADFGN